MDTHMGQEVRYRNIGCALHLNGYLQLNGVTKGSNSSEMKRRKAMEPKESELKKGTWVPCTKIFLGRKGLVIKIKFMVTRTRGK